MPPAEVNWTIELTPILVVVLTAVLGWLAWVIKRSIARADERHEEEKKERATREEAEAIWYSAISSSVRALSKDRIMQAHDHFTALGYMPSSSKDGLESLYQGYKGLGGNGICTAMRDEMIALPESLDIKKEGTD